MIRKSHFLLLAATVFTGATSAQAQTPGDVAAEIAALRAEVAALRSRVTGLETERAAAAATPQAQLATITAAQPQPAATAPAAREAGPEIRFRGAPTITAPGGWSFKPRGRL